MIDIANVEQVGNLEVLRAMIVPEHSRTAFFGEKIVAAAGVVPLWNGVGQGWAVVDTSVPQKFAVARAMRRGMRDIVRNGPFHRVHADVLADYSKGQKFLKMLGFTHEGPLEAFGPTGADYQRFAFVSRELIKEG